MWIIMKSMKNNEMSEISVNIEIKYENKKMAIIISKIW